MKTCTILIAYLILVESIACIASEDWDFFKRGGVTTIYDSVGYGPTVARSKRWADRPGQVTLYDHTSRTAQEPARLRWKRKLYVDGEEFDDQDEAQKLISIITSEVHHKRVPRQKLQPSSHNKKQKVSTFWHNHKWRRDTPLENTLVVLPAGGKMLRYLRSAHESNQGSTISNRKKNNQYTKNNPNNKKKLNDKNNLNNNKNNKINSNVKQITKRVVVPRNNGSKLLFPLSMIPARIIVPVQTDSRREDSDKMDGNGMEGGAALERSLKS